MKNVKSILSLTALLAAFSFAAFAQESETRNLGSFTRVSAAEGIEVTLKQGSSNSAQITADNIDLEDVLTEVSGNKLKIHLEGNNHRNVDVEVTITYTGTLESLSSSSGSSITCMDKITAGDFDIDVSSAGSIEATISADDVDIDGSSSGSVELTLSAADVTIDISSASTIKLNGDGNSLKVDASSAGTLLAGDFKVENADIEVSSGANAKVHVTGDLDGNASSGGSIRYSGSPHVDVRTSSGGSVRSN